MAEIDTSIYPKAQPPGSPLDMVDKIVGIRNALLTGQQQQQALQSGAINIQQQQYDLAMKHYQGMATFFSQLYAKPNLTKSDIIQAAADGQNMGLFTSGEAAAELGPMPDDNAGIHDHLKRLIFSATDGATRLQAIAPTPTMQNLGPSVQPIRTPQIGPVEAAGPPIPVGVSPETAIQRQNVMGGPGGAQPGTVPLGAMGGVPQSVGLPFPSGGAVSSPTGGSAAAPTAAPATGGPAPSAASPTGGQMGGFVPTGLPVGSTEYRQANATAAAHLAASTSEVGTSRGLLGNMAAEVATLPAQAIGPGSHFIQKAGQWLMEFGGGAASPLSAEQTGALDTFSKNAQQLATALLPQIGNSSDRSQLAAIASNPNQFLSKNGIARINAILNGSLDAIQAKNLAWQGSGIDPGDFFKWESNFNKDYDPRVFQFPHMTKEQQAETLSQLKSSGGLDKFKAYFNKAAHNGWIPSIQPQGQ